MFLHYLRDLGNRWHQPAMLFTIVRLLGSPALALYLLWNFSVVHRWIALALFFAIVITDVIDGILARWLDQVSDIGALLDPFVDKVLIVSVLTVLTIRLSLPWWILAIVVFREVVVTILRMWAARHGRVIAARTSGKVKMIVQSIVVAFCIVIPWPTVNMILLLAIVVVTMYSLFDYLRAIFHSSPEREYIKKGE